MMYSIAFALAALSLGPPAEAAQVPLDAEGYWVERDDAGVLDCTAREGRFRLSVELGESADLAAHGSLPEFMSIRRRVGGQVILVLRSGERFDFSLGEATEIHTVESMANGQPLVISAGGVGYTTRGASDSITSHDGRFVIALTVLSGGDLHLQRIQVFGEDGSLTNLSGCDQACLARTFQGQRFDPRLGFCGDAHPPVLADELNRETGE